MVQDEAEKSTSRFSDNDRVGKCSLNAISNGKASHRVQCHPAISLFDTLSSMQPGINAELEPVNENHSLSRYNFHRHIPSHSPWRLRWKAAKVNRAHTSPFIQKTKNDSLPPPSHRESERQEIALDMHRAALEEGLGPVRFPPRPERNNNLTKETGI
ncbi:malate dehydrogenase [Anopheles sinensis]|uniref:Malate dehydrogenase n=1 Tax=Anopheles sinensis TaxID=74873 RepID=A0A084WB16_ANOSI|nr:malate dehydrogenase [Anopheles sinensis]